MTKNRSTTLALRKAYRLMRRRHGHQNWWPGDTPFEVCVGAILTQNTSWRNVERAIARLKAAGVLDPVRMHALAEDQLAEHVRPTGYYRVKARRLRAFLGVLVEKHGGRVDRWLEGQTLDVRQRLLEVPGIGPETADSILLYAGEHLSFVVDAYTRRIFARHGWAPAEAAYDDVQALCATALRDRPGAILLDYWRDYHAQLVRVGKDYCRPRAPRCAGCPLEPLL